MTDSDMALIKRVHQERRGRFTISAYLTRFGTLNVLAASDDMGASWQGDSIIHARHWVDTNPQKDTQTPDLRK